jgi:predicted metal-dependent RNase
LKARFGAKVYVAHALATYTLEEALQQPLTLFGEDGMTPQWKAIILETIASTKIAYPNSEIVVFVDKRAFSAEHRDLISSLLEELRIRWTFKTADVKRMIKEDFKVVSVEVEEVVS